MPSKNLLWHHKNVWKQKFKLISSLCLGSGREGLTYKTTFSNLIKSRNVSLKVLRCLGWNLFKINMMHDKSIEYSGACTKLFFGFWVIQESSNKFDIVLFNSRKIACVSVHLGILKFRHLFEDSLICVQSIGGEFGRLLSHSRLYLSA